jgi:hypothetical protein
MIRPYRRIGSALILLSLLAPIRSRLLPGQVARGDRLQALPRDSHQGTSCLFRSGPPSLFRRRRLTLCYSTPQASSNKVSKNEQDLKEFADALEEHRAKGSEEQEMARKVQKSKRKATKGKARREFLTFHSPLRRVDADTFFFVTYSPSQGRFREPSFVAREVIRPLPARLDLALSLVLLPRPSFDPFSMLYYSHLFPLSATSCF